MKHKWLSVWTHPYHAVEGISNPAKVECVAAVGLRDDGNCFWAKGRDAEDAVRNLHGRLTLDADEHFKATPLTPEEMERIINIKGAYHAA